MNGGRKHPEPRELLPEITLPTSEGTLVRVSDLRGRRNLVLVFAGEPGDDAWLALASALAQREKDLSHEEAEVLLILQADVSEAAGVKAREDLPFRILADADCQTHAQFGLGTGGMAAPVVYLTDRFGEIFSVQPAAQALPLPAVREILEWLAFINSQCPECGVPHWMT
jgi:peroxiredoxin